MRCGRTRLNTKTKPPPPQPFKSQLSASSELNSLNYQIRCRDRCSPPQKTKMKGDLHAQTESAHSEQTPSPETLPKQFIRIFVETIHDHGHHWKQDEYELIPVTFGDWKGVCWHIKNPGESEWKCYEIRFHKDGRIQNHGPFNCPNTPSSEDN